MSSSSQPSHRIKRKSPPLFQYSERYPKPDPNDPFATLSELRGRATTLTNSEYDSPISAIQDPSPGASKVHDLATFIVQRKKAAAPGFQFEENLRASQIRKGASLGFGLHESPSSEAPTTTVRPGAREAQRRESRRRSQSVFAGAFSFFDPRGALEPHSNVDSPVSRRHSLLPYDSSTSVLTSSSTSSSGESTNGRRQANKASVRPRSCSSSFVTASLLDGVPEFPSDMLVHKSMRVMQVDMPAPRAAEGGSDYRPRILSSPPPLEKRSPSESSIGSWSRDLAFYSASSRPQTPSSFQSCRPTSLPPPAAHLPFPPVTLPSPSPPPFTTPPQISSTHQNVPTVATSLPPSSSSSRRVSTPPEGLDALNVRFPKQQRCVESEPESVGRENGRFARLRAHTSTGSQRISASSSLRSTLQAAADAAERLAQEASTHALPPVPTPAVTQAQPMVAENIVASPVVDSAPDSNELEVDQRAQAQSWSYPAGQHSRAPSPAFPHQNADNVPPAARDQSPSSVRPTLLKAVPKPESEPATTLKHRPLSRSPQRCLARRSTSTPLPISRPLPSPPTVTTHPSPEQVAKSPPTPPPRAHGHGLTGTQVQHALPAPSPSVHSAPNSHIAHAAPSAVSHTGLPAGAAAPRVPCAPAPHSALTFPPSQSGNLPPPRPLPRAAHTVPLPSRTVYTSTSSGVQSASSSSSHVDSLSTASAPQMRRRDASPSSSSHGRHSPHISEKHGQHHHHHHGNHPYHHGHPRSLSEPGAGMLSSTQLAHAARMPVVRENGVRVQFGELWRAQRTVVIFIRHFWYARIRIFLIILLLNMPHHAGAHCARTTLHRSCATQTTQRSRATACASS